MFPNGADATLRSTATIAPSVWLVGVGTGRGARRRGGAGTRAPRAREVDDRAGGILGRGRETGVAQRGEHLGDRRLRHRDGRREQPHLQLLGGGRGDGLRQQRRILAPHERLSHADPQLPVPACDVVDQIRQTLRHRRFRVSC